jgi:hypothetical protein
MSRSLSHPQKQHEPGDDEDAPAHAEQPRQATREDADANRPCDVS